MAWSQTQVVFFTESGEPFYLYMNNQLQNRAPQTQVRVSNLVLKDYQVSIEFKDITKPIIRDDLKIKHGKETVYVIFQDKGTWEWDLYTKAKRGMYSPQTAPVSVAPYANYQGAVSCPTPMSKSAFEAALQDVEKQEFTQAREETSRQLLTTQCITVDQLRQLLKTIDYEADRTKLAKFAYSYVFDRENYYQLGDVFTYPQTLEEIQQYIQEERSR